MSDPMGGGYVDGVAAAEWVDAERQPFTTEELQLDDAAGQAARRRSRKGAEHDAELAAHTALVNKVKKAFYVAVLITALIGQATGAVEVLGLPPLVAIGCVAVLELGGVVAMGIAESRRRLGETAVVPMLLAVAFGTFAVGFNLTAHENREAGAFFAFMSGAGFVVWVMTMEHRRRDRLRANGQMSELPPQYELVTHWLRRPMLTLRARSMARADPKLGMVRSLIAADRAMRRDRRLKAIERVLRRKIRKAVDPVTASIAINTYPLDEVADHLASRADIPGLSDLIAADLVPSRIAAHQTVRVESVVHRPPDEDMVRDVVQDALAAVVGGHLAAIEAATREATQRLESAANYAASHLPQLAASMATPAYVDGHEVAGEVADDPADAAATDGRDVAADEDEDAANETVEDDEEVADEDGGEDASEQQKQVDDRPPQPRAERPKDRKGTAAKVAAAIRRNPAITNAQLADRFGLAPRSVRRYATPVREAIGAHNGHDHSGQ